MTRLMIAASATALVAAASTAPAAHAGGKRFGFGFPIGVVHGGHAIGSSTYYEAERLEAERRAEAAEAARMRSRHKAAMAAAAAAAAHKRALAIAAAKAAARSATSEPTSATTTGEPVKTAGADPTTVGSLGSGSEQPEGQPGCKRYFAHVGMTISVPCTE
jgi:Skp family chaperone for outer membrane proteins